MTKTKKTWADIYRSACKRGDDSGYAGWLADQWEKRKKSVCGGYPVRKTLSRKADGRESITIDRLTNI